ncbi:hypothetical protein E2I00_014120 [Balaenoptera physalus]|uniref:Uncharacterized protein n=1 Tax=Balaenoptera physalus TaxID=9770 RepID=A0A6A1Q4S8_BALPH|nr:hypothetical protein E2I00_014120 [Balaenoptera physalus]
MAYIIALLSEKGYVSLWQRTSNLVRVKIQELFPPPVLTANTIWPTKESLVTLTCETPLSPQSQMPNFNFTSSEMVMLEQLPKAPDHCQVERRLRVFLVQGTEVTSCVWKQRQRFQIYVQTLMFPRVKPHLLSPIHTGIPVSCVSMETLPPKGRRRGHHLFLTQRGRGREGEFGDKNLAFPGSRVGQAGGYYSTADNSYGLIQSEAVNITVRSPVCRPVLTLRAPGAQAVVGNVMELPREARRGSPPSCTGFAMRMSAWGPARPHLEEEDPSFSL